MKYTAYALLCALLGGLSGCLDIAVRTTVSADGSVEREMSLRNRSKEVPDGAYPVALDSTWTVEWKETSDKDQKFEYDARKKFSSFEEFEHSMNEARRIGEVGTTVSMKRRFEWFYSYIDYRETFGKRDSSLVLVTDFLTRDEAERYVRGDKNDTLQQKIDLWNERVDFERFYRPLVAEAELRHDPEITPALLSEKKEYVFHYVLAADSGSKKSRKGTSDSSTKSIDSPKEVVRVLAQALGTRAIVRFLPVVEQVWARVEHEELNQKHADGWTCSLQIPGVLVETNSDNVEGNNLTWKFEWKQVNVGDYAMTATSRVANVWAFVVTGSAVFLVIAVGTAASLRRRKGNGVRRVTAPGK